MSVHWLPRRHLVRFHSGLHLERVHSRVGICQQRERRDVAGTMARLAVLLKNPDDLIVEGDGLRARFDGAKQDGRS
jgi:hypothetical protein